MDKFTPEQLRMMKKLSQKEVAKKLGMSPRTYAYKECGEREFTFLEMLGFADLVGVEITRITPVYNQKKQLK